jgi:hypothetical protein
MPSLPAVDLIQALEPLTPRVSTYHTALFGRIDDIEEDIGYLRSTFEVQKGGTTRGLSQVSIAATCSSMTRI